MTDQTTEIVEVQSREIEPVQMGSLQASSHQHIVIMATAIANELSKIVDEQHLYSNISGKKYVTVEGWTTMGSMLGITPKERYAKRIDDDDYEAYVELIRNSDGAIIGGASSIVSSDENTWSSRPRYARRSMAVTRATGKAFRLGYSWIMRLAGYEPTPAEEMDGVTDGQYREVSKSAPKPKAQTHQKPKHDFSTRPYDPETLRAALHVKAEKVGQYDATDKQRNFLGMLLSEYYGGDTDKRHTAQEWLLGAKSTKEIDGALVKVALDWLNPQDATDGSGGKVIDEISRKELSAVYDAAVAEEGQQALL